MLESIPTAEEMTALLGEHLYSVWQELCGRIDEKYEMELIPNKGFGDWIYELKYRRGGKTLCTLYAKKDVMSFWVILGRDERAKFEARRSEFSADIQKIYDETKSYHDGKWLMFEPKDDTLFDDFMALLALKRKPNRK
ncbi:MAG: DUF3788 domain-containing protein [Oscillospiraceae bacterium]|nr:DUF3788 domain-containing protein [Oscillospiraceae bacterium]